MPFFSYQIDCGLEVALYPLPRLTAVRRTQTNGEAPPQDRLAAALLDVAPLLLALPAARFATVGRQIAAGCDAELLCICVEAGPGDALTVGVDPDVYAAWLRTVGIEDATTVSDRDLARLRLLHGLVAPAIPPSAERHQDSCHPSHTGDTKPAVDARRLMRLAAALAASADSTGCSEGLVVVGTVEMAALLRALGTRNPAGAEPLLQEEATSADAEDVDASCRPANPQ